MKDTKIDNSVYVPSRQTMNRRSLKKIGLLSLFGLGAFYYYNELKEFTGDLIIETKAFLKRTEISNIKCPKQPLKLNLGEDWNPHKDTESQQLLKTRLSEAIQIQTVTWDNMRDVEDERFDIFEKFYAYLENTYPTIFNSDSFTKEKINKHGILITWKGTESSLKPIVLMSHQDVVPVPENTVERWKYPPFSGVVDADGWMWGRGTCDCKNSLIGLLSAIDRLVSENYTPRRTVILSFGFDEEISGHLGANTIAETLRERYGSDGISFIVDEGFSGIIDRFGQRFALLGVAEKGSFSLRLSVGTEGGHASNPPEHTAVGLLSKLITVLEQKPDQVSIDAKNPILPFLVCAAERNLFGHRLRKAVSNPAYWPKLAKMLVEKLPILTPFLRTTQAVNIVRGGIKVNALPEHAEALINYRILFSSTTDKTFKRISRLVEAESARLGLKYYVGDDNKNVTTNVVRLEIASSELNPAPLTPIESKQVDLVGGTIKHLWKGAIIAPTGMVGNTDTRYYWDLTKHIYRFTPANFEKLIGFHTVNERIHLSAHLDTIRFYYKLIRNSEALDD